MGERSQRGQRAPHGPAQLGQRSSTGIPSTQHTAAWAELGSEGGGWLWHSQHELMSRDMGFSDLNWEPGCLQGL